MLSQRAKYALKAMICLAEHRGPEPMSVTEIARAAPPPDPDVLLRDVYVSY